MLYLNQNNALDFKISAENTKKRIVVLKSWYAHWVLCTYLFLFLVSEDIIHEKKYENQI